MPTRLQIIDLADLIEDVAAAASLKPLAHECHFTVIPVDKQIKIKINVDAEMLASAVGNLLQNAFKFTKPHTKVTLHAYRLNDRVHIAIEDRCGGLSSGTLNKLTRPFVQNSADRSGLGLGLDISRRSAEANGGSLDVRDMPEFGCVFTIDLPRYAGWVDLPPEFTARTLRANPICCSPAAYRPPLGWNARDCAGHHPNVEVTPGIDFGVQAHRRGFDHSQDPSRRCFDFVPDLQVLIPVAGQMGLSKIYPNFLNKGLMRSAFTDRCRPRSRKF